MAAFAFSVEASMQDQKWLFQALVLVATGTWVVESQTYQIFYQTMCSCVTTIEHMLCVLHV